MRLVLMRHGEAENLVTQDAERALTPHGRAQAAATAALLRETLAAANPPYLLCSPYRRAQETAAIMAQACGPLPVHIEPALTPDTNVRLALQTLVGRADSLPDDENATLLVVSHMPLLALLAAWLEQGDLQSGRGFLTAEARLLQGQHLLAGQMRCTASFMPGISP